VILNFDVTAAPKSTEAPSLAGFSQDVTVVVVVFPFITWIRTAEVPALL
jgi:hypothetical protein